MVNTLDGVNSLETMEWVSSIRLRYNTFDDRYP